MGEQQRVGFIRLFYALPQFVFMDESTSALDVVLVCTQLCPPRVVDGVTFSQAKCMAWVRKLGITSVSVAHSRRCSGITRCVQPRRARCIYMCLSGVLVRVGLRSCICQRVELSIACSLQLVACSTCTRCWVH